MNASAVKVLQIVGYVLAAITLITVPITFLFKIPVFINPILTGLLGNFAGAILYYSKDEAAKKKSQGIIWANIIAMIIGIASFFYFFVYLAL